MEIAQILMSEEEECMRIDVLLGKRPQTTLHVLKNHSRIKDKLAEAVRGIATGMIYCGYNGHENNNYHMVNGKKWDCEKRDIIDAQQIDAESYRMLESVLINEMRRLTV